MQHVPISYSSLVYRYDPNANNVCFCFPFPLFFPPATASSGTAASTSPSPTASSCAARPGAHADVAGGVLPRMCCNWPVRAETTGAALGAAELGRIGNAAFVSEGAGGGAGGGFPPWDVFETALVLSPLLLPPPPPPPTLAADADHAVLRTPRLRTLGVGPVFGDCGAWGGVVLCDRGCCCCCRSGALRGGKVAPRSAACATRSHTARWVCLGGAARCALAALTARPLAIRA